MELRLCVDVPASGLLPVSAGIEDAALSPTTTVVTFHLEGAENFSDFIEWFLALGEKRALHGGVKCSVPANGAIKCDVRVAVPQCARPILHLYHSAASVAALDRPTLANTARRRR